MKQKLISQSLLLFLISFSVLYSQHTSYNATLDLEKVDYKISRNIYGNFSEHLGNCIYGGFWVGENSSIPNVRGIRTDVVEAMSSALDSKIIALDGKRQKGTI
jgi:alpha-N-arabinofuranosidase